MGIFLKLAYLLLYRVCFWMGIRVAFSPVYFLAILNGNGLILDFALALTCHYMAGGYVLCI